jgi:hypothetical protein
MTNEALKSMQSKWNNGPIIIYANVYYKYTHESFKLDNEILFYFYNNIR